jgi:trk system potassium uptake protein TrkA
MEKTFAVIGLGTFGRKVCEVLAEKGGSVIALDNDPVLVERLTQTVTQAVLVDATDEEALANAPLEDVDVAVVAIGDNVEASILTTALLKSMAIPYVLARATSPLHQQVLRRVGADEVVNIEIAEGSRIASRLIAPQVLDQYPITKDISIAELHVPKSLVDATLAKLDLRNRYRVNVVAIRRADVEVDELGNPDRREVVLFPGPDDVLQSEDVILVVGRNADIDAFREL